MKTYLKICALLLNFNSKVICGINFGKKVKIRKSNKFLPSVQMIDQTFRIKTLKDKVTP